MTDFQHSIVLFSGEDGLPLEFNVRNTDEKALLKALIEHGGGLCSQSDSAAHLISPGTKVLNADLGKKLVSTQYIYDCVKQNYLLDVNDYVFTVSEARTSDISDEESENIISNKQVKRPNVNLLDNLEIIDMDIDETLLSSLPAMDKSSKSFVSGPTQNEMHLNLTSSNTSESFIEGSVGVDSHFKVSSMPSKIMFSPDDKPFTSTAKDAFTKNAHINLGGISDELSPIKGLQSLASPLKTNIFSNDALKTVIQSQKVDFNEHPPKPSPVHTAVSSSQPTAEFDEFDNLLLSKARQKQQLDDEENCSSQSYTVSSSADAQVDSKRNSEEIFAGGSSAVPDSPMQNENLTKQHQDLLKDLETEVENILKKPSPKSIKDKICLVKYLCCVMKLPPAKVLEMLPRL